MQPYIKVILNVLINKIFKIGKKEYDILMKVKDGYAVIQIFDKEQCQKCIDDIDNMFEIMKFVQKQGS